MADTTTTTYSLIKVEVGGSTDTWGTKWNANADAIDAALTALVKRDGSRSFTSSVDFAAGFSIGGASAFTSTVSGGTLSIKYNGDTILTLTSAGVLTAVDVVGDDTL